MQIHRMVEIIYLLMHKKTVTAKQLADHFEVSTRTAYRDIDTLCKAGIPIYTTKGKGGGIHLIDSFVLNKWILSEQEQRRDSIFIAWTTRSDGTYRSGAYQARNQAVRLNRCGFGLKIRHGT